MSRQLRIALPCQHEHLEKFLKQNQVAAKDIEQCFKRCQGTTVGKIRLLWFRGKVSKRFVLCENCFEDSKPWW